MVQLHEGVVPYNICRKELNSRGKTMIMHEAHLSKLALQFQKR